MAGSSEKQEHIHWLEISESLGVDVSREIEYYFNGVADLGGNPPQPDDVQTEVSPTARQLALTANANSASQPETSKMERVNTTSMSVESTRQSNSNNPQSARVAQRTVSKDKNDDKQIESRDDSVNILGLDWSTPAPPSAETPATRDKSETEQPQREKKPEPKRAAVERKSAPTRSDSQKPDVDLLGWGTGAGESVARETVQAQSIEEQPPTLEKKKEPRPERHVEKPAPKATNPKRESATSDDVLLDGFGAGLIDPSDASQTTSREKPRSPVNEVPNKPFREAKVEKADQVDPLGFFDTEANKPKGSDLLDDESFDSLDDDDQIEEVEEPLLESAWDEDFVEFEVEDLDPNAGRQPNRKRDGRESRPARVEKPARREIPLQDDDSADMDADSNSDAAVSKDTRSDKSEREGATRSGTRSSRRRKPRGRRRSGESQSGEKTGSNALNPPEAAPRSRKPTSTPKPRVESLDGDFDDDDDFETMRPSDETRSSKSRNLPTWNETVDVIVQSNIASRKKPPSRRRRGGGGGQNRQR